MRHSQVVSFSGVPDLVLLDLNYTLVENSDETMIAHRYSEERYRRWLIDLLVRSGAEVHLVTVREAESRDVTLQRILELTGWQPHMAHFRPSSGQYPSAAHWKRAVFIDHVAKTSRCAAKVLALESNQSVHRVYDQLGVPWAKVERGDEWTEIPQWEVSAPTPSLF